MLIIYFFFFIFLTWRNQVLGLALVAALLPSYLIRFQLFGLPMTVLEGMILIITAIWFIKFVFEERGKGKEERGNKIQYSISNIFNIPNILPWSWLAAIGLFLFAATISIFVSPNLRTALGIWKAYFVEPILLFVVFISTIKTREDLNKVIWGLVLGTLPVALFAIIQKFTGWLIPNPFWQAEETRRVTSFFGYPNAVALYLAPIIPFTIYLLIHRIKEQRTRNKEQFLFLIFLFLILCSLFLAVIFAHSTGALVALATTTILFGLFNKKTRWWIAGLMIALAILLPLTPLKESFQREILLGDRSGTVRLNMWAETIEMLKTRPIFGAGLAGYQPTVQSYHILNWAEIYLYPHNLFLNFWSETGLLGLISFLWLIILFFKTGWKTMKEQGTRNKEQFVLLAAMLIILIHGLVDVPYFKNDLAVMFWLLIGLRLIDIKLNLLS